MRVTKPLEDMALLYLKGRQWITFKRLGGQIDAEHPKWLMQRYAEKYQKSPVALQALVAEVVQTSPDELKTQLSPDEYRAFKESLEGQLEVFHHKHYQLGALDLEIDVVVALLEQFENPQVLEIGVANGYSSAFLYYVVSHGSGTITSIDLPRFSGSLVSLRDKMRRWLVNRGRIVNTGTLGDLNPGGIIPQEKFAGWLVPIDLRRTVPNTTIYGNVFHVLSEVRDVPFDFVVFDAMKSYAARMRVLEQILERLKPNGVCIVDGYWVNSAFQDFCQQHRLPWWQVGRIGIFANRRELKESRRKSW